MDHPKKCNEVVRIVVVIQLVRLLSLLHHDGHRGDWLFILIVVLWFHLVSVNEMLGQDFLLVFLAFANLTKTLKQMMILHGLNMRFHTVNKSQP